jgi:hypothetical protein
MTDPEERVWIGIDEAGYGPNLGPLVMTAVVAAGTGEDRPDVWGELAGVVDRAGGAADRLWVDDSKRVYAARDGLERLRAGALAAIGATGAALPEDDLELVAAVDPSDPSRGELMDWVEDSPARIEAERASGAGLRCGRWGVVAVHSRVVGPARFNGLIEETGSKAAAHARIFVEVLRAAWDRRTEARSAMLSDKHGGRNRYAPMLVEGWPEGWVERGEEGPEVSGYRLVVAGRRLDLEFRPRSDQSDGLVALASMVSKYARERWLRAFHRFWAARVPGLRATAGYPVDARRYRAEIEEMARELGIGVERWWRSR